MGCRSKVELNVWQIFLICFLCIAAVLVAVVGWFRTIDPVEYETLPSSTYNKTSFNAIHLNNVTATVNSHLRLSPFLDDIGAPPLLHDPNSYIQWTFLHMNDVYELIPLGGGKKGGLARVATIRQLLLKENPHTITILSGDIVSPSALGNSVVNGSKLNGKQMIATLNVLGLDYATLGNHEFDLKQASLRHRIAESKFEWISSNVYERNTTKPFENILQYKMLTISNVKILLIGLTIDDNQGAPPYPPYATITPQQNLPEFTASYIKLLRDERHLVWDVLICLTHLNLQTDIEVAERNPDIDVIFGGHEHENYFLKRGLKYTPIYKADDNAFTVFVHRFAYQPKTKHLLIHSKLTRVSAHFPDEPKTAEVANYYYRVGLEAYLELGFIPKKVVCVLPLGLSFDGRSSVIRAQQTYLTETLCGAMMAVSNTSVCVFNAGAIRLDDTIVGTITQYDILRCLPFATNVTSIRVKGSTLAKVLMGGMRNINTGMYISYVGVIFDPVAKQWFLKGNRQPIDDEKLLLKIVTIPYFIENTELKQSAEIVGSHGTMTRAFINYLERVYHTKTSKRSF